MATVSVARAVSDSLGFQSVCGGIKLNFQMPGVTKVELESVDGYALSGKAKLEWDGQGLPVVAETSDTDYILTFNAPDALRPLRGLQAVHLQRRIGRRLFRCASDGGTCLLHHPE